MDPSSQQQTPPIKHMMSIPEKIELTSTGAYPSPQSSGQRQDTRAYRAMRVPDKIMLESTGEREGERRGEGEGEGGRQGMGGSGGVGGYFQQAQPPSSEPVLETHVTTASKQSRPLVTLQGDQAMLQNLDRRVQSLEQQMRSVKQAVLQQNSRGTPERRGYGVWNALTFAGWLMVPLVVVFMFHYRKTAH